MGRNRLARGTTKTESPERVLALELHRGCSEPRDWYRIATAPEPRRPAYCAEAEVAARAALDAYDPHVLDRWSGKAGSRRAELEENVRDATAADAARYQAELTRHRLADRAWRARIAFATRVLRYDLAACRAALPGVGEFAALGIQFELVSIAERVATVRCVLAEPMRVPLEEIDAHLSSCAIRAAREAFAALPALDAVVEIAVERRDVLTGATTVHVVLTAGFAYEMMVKLEGVDGRADELLAHVPHRRQRSPAADRPTPTPTPTPTPMVPS